MSSLTEAQQAAGEAIEERGEVILGSGFRFYSRYRINFNLSL